MGLVIAEATLGDHARSGQFERNFPMKLVIGLVAGASALCLASSAFAAPPPPIAPGDGAFTVLFFKSDHRAVAVAAVTAFMKSTPTSKALASGVCVSRTNATDFLTYGTYANFEDLLTTRSVMPSAETLALWKLQYRAHFKPLIPFTSPDGKTVEHFFRFSVPTNNTDAFAQAAAKLSAQLAADNKGASLLVAMPVGGGEDEANVMHVRMIYPDNKSLGMALDNFFKGGKAGVPFREMRALATGMIGNIEDCEQFPIAQK